MDGFVPAGWLRTQISAAPIAFSGGVHQDAALRRRPLDRRVGSRNVYQPDKTALIRFLTTGNTRALRHVFAGWL